MLKLYYSQDTLNKTVKTNIDDLANTLSLSYNVDSETWKKYFEEYYKPKIVSIASNIERNIKQDEYKPAKEVIALLQSTDKFDSFDLRYVQNFDGNWTKEIDEKAKINQTIVDLCRKYQIETMPEAYFILSAALKYISLKNIDTFSLKVKETTKTDIDSLKELSKEKFDYMECPFNASMENFCHVFTKDRILYARFKRDEFEFYLLSQLYNCAVNEILEQGLEKINLISSARTLAESRINIDFTYADTIIEKLDSMLDSSIIASVFITNALRNATRTITCLNLDGKERDYFLSGLDLFADEIYIENAGIYALGHDTKESALNVKRLIVEKASDWLGARSTLKSEYVYLKNIRDGAFLSGTPGRHSNHSINRLVVETAGDHFLGHSNITCNYMHLQNVGDRALWDYEGISKHRIKVLKVDSAKYGIGEQSNFECDQVELKSVWSKALSGCNSTSSKHKIKELIVGKALSGFGDDCTFECDIACLDDVYCGDIKDIMEKFIGLDGPDNKLVINPQIQMKRYLRELSDNQIEHKITAENKKWWMFWK